MPLTAAVDWRSFEEDHLFVGAYSRLLRKRRRRGTRFAFALVT